MKEDDNNILDPRDAQIEALRDSLLLAYDLVFKYWNGLDYDSGDNAKELRRDIFYLCLKPNDIEHPLGWGS